MMSHSKLLLAMALTVATASHAFAEITAVRGVSIASGNNEADVVNQLFIDFTGQLGGQQLYIELTSGTIYNTAGFGADTAPGAAFVTLVPELAEDSYVTMGGATSEESEGVLVVGGAVNLPGAPAGLNVGMPDPSLVSVAWAPAAGVVIADRTDFLVAQISLSSDAMGSAWFFSSTLGEEPYVTAGTIWDGVLFEVVPETNAILLASLAATASLVRTRR